MHKKVFEDYKEFLKVAEEHKKDLTNISYFDGRLYSFNYGSFRNKYLIDTGKGLSPNSFCKMLGVNNYNCFCYKCISRISEFENETNDSFEKWKNGFFGGLIGINTNIINKYVGTGEVNVFYDYDINSAYLTQLTNFIPSKFVKTILKNDFEKLNEIDKIPYIYFFEIEIDTIKGQFLKATGKLRSCYSMFDFLLTKNKSKMIVSEIRLDLINQIYFKECYKIKKIFVFEKHKFTIFDKVLQRFFIEKKTSKDKDILKKNALKLYGCFGQLYKKKIKNIDFEKNGDLFCVCELIKNEKASPQIAMWVADSVAKRLFETILSNGVENCLSWNTDGITALKPLKVQCSQSLGKWKFKKIVGVPFLLSEDGSRCIYKNMIDNSFCGSDSILFKNNKLYQEYLFKYSNTKKGYCVISKKYEIDKSITFDKNKTLRNLIIAEKFRTEVLGEYRETF